MQDKTEIIKWICYVWHFQKYYFNNIKGIAVILFAISSVSHATHNLYTFGLCVLIET